MILTFHVNVLKETQKCVPLGSDCCCRALVCLKVKQLCASLETEAELIFEL